MLVTSLSVASGIWLWILCDSFWCLTACKPEFFWRLWLCPGFYHTEYDRVLMQSDFLTVEVYPAGLFPVCKFSNTYSEFPNSVVHRGSELLSWLNTSLFGVVPHNCSNLSMTMSSCCSGSRRECFPSSSFHLCWPYRLILAPLLSLLSFSSGSCLPPLPSSTTFSSSSPSSLPHVGENSSEPPVLKDGHCFSRFTLWLNQRCFQLSLTFYDSHYLIFFFFLLNQFIP